MVRRSPYDELIAPGMAQIEALRERQRHIRCATQELGEIKKTPAV
ncbi:MAG: hypothetical protein OEU26_06045 [Candidatus Tectomicrobia bacterium]|nr:hypothetical protein [Candidatus Tectomicrobia bacterium]